MAHILLTGATGFVGRNVLPALLARGHAVRALVRTRATLDDFPSVETVVGDLRSPPLGGIDAVVHLAAIVDPAKQADAREVTAVVAGATLELADRARAAGVRTFVFTSSIAAVGFRDGPVTARSPCAPTTPYGIAKRAAEVGLLARDDATFRAVILRPPTIHGPGERYNFLSLVRAIQRGVFRTIGGGDNVFPLVSAANVARAIVHAVEGSVPGGVHPLADAEPYPLRRLHQAIARALGVAMPRVSIPRPVARAVAVLNEAIAPLGVPLLLGRDRLRTLTVDQPFDVTTLLAANVPLTATLEADVRETIADQRRRGWLDQ